MIKSVVSGALGKIQSILSREPKMINLFVQFKCHNTTMVQHIQKRQQTDDIFVTVNFLHFGIVCAPSFSAYLIFYSTWKLNIRSLITVDERDDGNLFGCNIIEFPFFFSMKFSRNVNL